MSFQDIWCKIEKHAGEVFHTKDGTEFTYEVQGDQFIAAKGDQTISKSNFEEAYQSTDVDPEEMVKIVKGPAYVWSVLHDKRIAQQIIKKKYKWEIGRHLMPAFAQAIYLKIKGFSITHNLSPPPFFIFPYFITILLYK